MPEEITSYIFDCFKSLFLGIVQGFTEFLPISSTAHLKVVPFLLGWNDPGVSFSASIQLGSAAAIIYYFRNQVTLITKSFFSIFNQHKVTKVDDNKLFRYIVVANVPILIFALLIKFYWPNYSNSNFRGLFSIAITSIFMALLLAFAELNGKKLKLFSDINLKDILFIGFAQSLALFPGVSRSGITLTSALFSDIERKTAARLSFLVGIPAISISWLSEFITLFRTLSLLDFLPTIVGIISSFFASLFAIDFFLRFLGSNTTLVFVYYRIAFGAFILLVL